MLRNYLVIGLRNLLKEKAFSSIKIVGLSFGLAVSMIIYLYVMEDIGFDTFNKNYSNMVRLLTIDSAEGVSSKLVGVTQGGLGPAAETELPEVVKSVRFTGGGRYDLAYGDQTLKCEAAFRVDPSVFEVFDFRIVDGQPQGALDQPGSIVITEALAKKIFGNDRAVGKTLKLNQAVDLHITAVMADVPRNSHLQFDLLHSLVPGQNENGLKQALESWQGIFCFTYLQLDGPPKVEDLNSKIQAIAKKNNANEVFTPVVQPLKDVHLKSKEILFEANANKSDWLNVYVLSSIALLIVILAVVNFTNLVTARSVARAKEVGLRKVIGAVRSQLIGQHLSESLLVVLFSALVAVLLVIAGVPILNNLYQRYADLTLLYQPLTLAGLAAFILVVGFFSGLYPAFVLSSFKPIAVLKGSFSGSTAGIQLRKALVVVQFTISIALMVGTGIVYRQMNFIYTADLGYNRDQVITIQQNRTTGPRASTLRDALLQNPHILSVGTASARLGQQLGRTNIIPEGADSKSNIITSIMVADENFIPAMGMTMAAGRNFSLEFSDSLNMLINEEMTRLLKWDNAVGRKISIQTGPNPTDLTAYTVVGVVKDFHFATIRHQLEPLFILYGKNNFALAIKASADDMQNTIAFIEQTWKQVNPGATFEYAFLDDQFAQLYKNDQVFARMFSHFTGLAIFIAMLGLLALSAFTAEQRRKEIGIRKVLGASQTSILLKLSGEFIQLILVAIVLASLIAYPAMNSWLGEFRYHIPIEPMVFVVAGAASILIALATVSFQALRAARDNPATSLRAE